MGTETGGIIYGCRTTVDTVKLNNPLMGTETNHTYRYYLRFFLS